MTTDPAPQDDSATSSPQESQRPQKAYALFLSLGDGRTYQQVADRMGVALATVKRWAKTGRWQSKVREREAQAAREVADRFQSGRIAETERNLKIVRAALLRLAKDIAEGRVKSTLSDLPRLVQLEQDLLHPSKPTSAEARYSNMTTEEMKARIREIGLSLLRDCSDIRNELIAMSAEQGTPANKEAAELPMEGHDVNDLP